MYVSGNVRATCRSHKTSARAIHRSDLQVPPTETRSVNFSKWPSTPTFNASGSESSWNWKGPRPARVLTSSNACCANSSFTELHKARMSLNRNFPVLRFKSPEPSLSLKRWPAHERVRTCVLAPAATAATTTPSPIGCALTSHVATAVPRKPYLTRIAPVLFAEPRQVSGSVGVRLLFVQFVSTTGTSPQSESAACAVRNKSSHPVSGACFAFVADCCSYESTCFSASGRLVDALRAAVASAASSVESSAVSMGVGFGFGGADDDDGKFLASAASRAFRRISPSVTGVAFVWFCVVEAATPLVSPFLRLTCIKSPRVTPHCRSVEDSGLPRPAPSSSSPFKETITFSCKISSPSHKS
mmetsp:Transcript_1190/g.3909  ORF Transcript_1190/g.3909 Transcript_1190/m.3909 type:complete len:357 (+) Transcript_1190:2040-3110(+)